MHRPRRRVVTQRLKPLIEPLIRHLPIPFPRMVPRRAAVVDYKHFMYAPQYTDPTYFE